MTCAAIFDCFLIPAPPKYDLYKLIFGITDLSLTSSIGVGFGIAALADAGVFSSQKQTILVYLAAVVTLFHLWY